MQKIMKKERYLAIFFFVAAFIISLLVGTLSMRKAEAEVNYNAPQIQAEYALDTTFTLPTVSFDIDGEAVATKGSLKFPSGKIYTNQTIVLNEEGSYELQYQAVVEGKLYQNKIPFIVKADFADLFDTTKNVSMQYGESTIWDEGENVSGLQVEMLGSDVLTYNRAINLNSLTKEMPFIELAAIPGAIGSQDFSEFVIKIMDADNEDAYMTIRVYDHFNGAGNHNGAYIVHSWCGIDMSPYGGNATKFSFAGLNDFKTVRVYYEPETYTFYTGISFYSGKEDKLVSYADKAEWLNIENVKVQVSVGGVTTKAKYIVTQIAGVDFTENTVQDVASPILNVQDISDKVVAEVGTPFKIFPFTASDNYSSMETWQTVTYSIGGSELKLDKNGYFTPDKAGFCYINYFAKDAMGNLAEKHVKIAVKENLDPLTIDVENDGVEAYTVGERIYARKYVCYGGAGENVESIVVTNTTNGKTYTLDGAKAFIPQEAGAYTVVYKVTDYLGAESESSYSLNVTLSDKIVVANELVLPPVFINDITYDLTGITGYDYVKNAAVSPKIYIKEGNKAEQEIANGTFKPTGYADGTQLQVIYRFGTGANAVEKSAIKTVKNIKQGYGFMSNYFVGEGVSATASLSNVAATTSADNQTIFFANKVGSAPLNLNLGVKSAGDLTIKIYDSKNSNQVVVIKIGADNSVTVNGRDNYSLNYTMTGQDEKRFQIAFDGNAFSNAFNGVLSEYLDGNTFAGFESGYVYCSFEMEKQGTLSVYAINEQVFTTSPIDSSAPIINASKTQGGILELGESVTIYAASAYDVLSDVVNFSVSVQNSKGDSCYSKDGKEMYLQAASRDYTIVFPEAGDYIVTFYARDSAGRSATAVKNFKVLDLSQKPSVSLKGAYNKEYAVGDVVTVIKADVSANATLYIFLEAQNGYHVDLTNKNVFTLTEKGTYTFVYFVVDQNGNVNYVESSIVVR